jgi:hypothetical protein
MHQRPDPTVENGAAMEIPPEQRQRIQMVLLRKSGMTQPLVAAAKRIASIATRHWASVIP